MLEISCFVGYSSHSAVKDGWNISAGFLRALRVNMKFDFIVLSIEKFSQKFYRKKSLFSEKGGSVRDNWCEFLAFLYCRLVCVNY